MASLDLKLFRWDSLPFIVRLLWHSQPARRKAPDAVERRFARQHAVEPHSHAESRTKSSGATGLVEGLWPFVQRNSLSWKYSPAPKKLIGVWECLGGCVLIVLLFAVLNLSKIVNSLRVAMKFMKIDQSVKIKIFALYF